jgi:hypothetical protein
MDQHAIHCNFEYDDIPYTAEIRHVLDLSEEEKKKYLMQEDCFLVFLKSSQGEKNFELFIEAGETHWKTKSDLIDPAIVEILGNKIDDKHK